MITVNLSEEDAKKILGEIITVRDTVLFFHYPNLHTLEHLLSKLLGHK